MKTVRSATVVLICLAGLAWAAPIDITGYTLTGSTNGSGEFNADDAAVASITTAEGTFSNFIVPTEVNVTSAPGFVFAGQAEPLAVNDMATQELSVLGNTPTRGWAGGGTNGVVDLLFGQTIFDGAGDELFALELGGGDDFTLQAIVGGTVGAPTLGGSALTVTASTVTAQPEVAITVSNNTPNTFFLGGTAFSVSDFGVTDLIGVRYSTTAGADIATILAVPEPATLSLTALVGSVAVLMRRRRA